MITVPKLWVGDTVVCIGTGPSLTQEDVDLVRGRARVIAVNDAYRLAPWADLLYACDEKWWKWQSRSHAETIAAFAGFKYALQGVPSRFVSGVQVLRNFGEQGLSLDPSGLRHGRCSGYQAMNLAVHLGAGKIVLLGYDMGMGSANKSHFFGAHPDRTKPLFRLCLNNFKTLVGPLDRLNISVVNASRQSALRCFPHEELERAMHSQVAA